MEAGQQPLYPPTRVPRSRNRVCARAVPCTVLHAPTDHHGTVRTLVQARWMPTPSIPTRALHSNSRAVFFICSFNMQSTNCTAYIAPEVGLSIRVNTLFPLLPCYCVSPHFKTGAAQTIFLAGCPPRSQPQKTSSVVHLPSTLPIYVSSPHRSHISETGLSPTTGFLLPFHIRRSGGPSVCTMDSL